MNNADFTTRDGLERVLSVTQAVAREAATLVASGFRKTLTVEHKGAVDLVTSFDRDSERLIRRRLGEAFAIPIIGEELGGDAPREDTAFYVDPLDGTTNFVHGHPFWCVSIGLVVAGQPVLGVVVSPPLGLEWFGWVASGGAPAGEDRRRAGRQGADLEPCVVSQRAALDEALLATGFPYDRRTNPEESNFDEFVAIKLRCQGVRRCGSAALDLCLVADGTYDGYWEAKLRPWDIAAGSAIVRAAGGEVTDYDGGSRFLETGRLIATNGALHGTLRAELAAVRTRASAR